MDTVERFPVRQLRDQWQVLLLETVWIACKSEADARTVANLPVLWKKIEEEGEDPEGDEATSIVHILGESALDTIRMNWGLSSDDDSWWR